jgi:hypothetical protein
MSPRQHNQSEHNASALLFAMISNARSGCTTLNGQQRLSRPLEGFLLLNAARHPGESPSEEFLKQLGMSVNTLAVPPLRVPATPQRRAVGTTVNATVPNFCVSDQGCSPHQTRGHCKIQ